MIKIELLINENDEAMARQLLALAIKKKYKDRIRPYYEIYTDEGMEVITNRELQNQLWTDDSGQDFDF